MMRRCGGSVIVPIVRFDQHRHEYEVYQPIHRITEIKAIQKRTERERERRTSTQPSNGAPFNIRYTKNQMFTN